MNIYETSRLLAEYLLFHYASDEEVMPWEFGPQSALGFARRSVTDLINPAIIPKNARSLDLGCAVGRSTYELARVSAEVVGIDYSASFIEFAEKIRSDGAAPYLRADEAFNETMIEARRPSDVDAGCIRFEQGDAMNLRSDLGSFDVVHAANLLCRLTDPLKLIERLPSLVKPGGQLLLTTPCTWLEEFTPYENWPDCATRDWLKHVLSADFELELEKDMPFLIREHARKYQWSVALGMRWRRKVEGV